jgi:SAM-dependent methyltransferase
VSALAPLAEAIAAAERPADLAAPQLLCWRCQATLIALAGQAEARVIEHHCCHCGAITLCRSGIWRCLSPQQVSHYETFVRDYESIRAAEGRGSIDPAYYLALPYHDLTGALSAQWKIRARTFDSIARQVLAPRARARHRPLRILDLGAGNGWLSYRLALLGHAPTAVDLLTNIRDGLGAAANYAPHLPTLFPRVQAALDQLPFPAESFDLAIYNASFHYAQDYRRTLAEALRCLRPGGSVVIADTPWYAREQSGEAMVQEKRARFQSLYGFRSCSIPSQEFLTPQRLDALAAHFHLAWQTISPFYGVAWALRPLRARLRGRRVPSQFRIYVADKPLPDHPLSESTTAELRA